MSRIAFLFSFLMVSVFPQAVLADQSCVHQAVVERHGIEPAADLVETSFEPLYIELTPSLSVGDLVRFEIRGEGLPLLTEQFRLTEAPLVTEVDGATLPTATPVVELLAAHSPRLDLLRRAAVKGAVEIAVFHGDSHLGSFDLAYLDQRSTEMLASVGVSPFGLRSTVSEVAAVRVEKNSQCESYCEDEQDFCYLNRCGQFGSASCYDACDREYIECLESCGICQPSSSTTVSEEVVSTTPTSTVFCTRSFFNWSVTGYQRLMDRQIKRTETTTTVNSDCSETVTTNVSYYNSFCWKWVNYNTCPYVRVENPAANC